LKLIDPEIHQAFTGCRNERILANFRKMLDCLGPSRIDPRIPLIPVLNTDASALMGLASFIRATAHPGPVHIMPYNGLAREKWKRIGWEHRYRPIDARGEETIAAAQSIFRKLSLDGICMH
jgi:pyruvate-formate lyase-activating enzyme